MKSISAGADARQKISGVNGLKFFSEKKEAYSEYTAK